MPSRGADELDQLPAAHLPGPEVPIFDGLLTGELGRTRSARHDHASVAVTLAPVSIGDRSCESAGTLP